MSPNEQRRVRGTKQADTFGVMAARHFAKLASRSSLLHSVGDRVSVTAWWAASSISTVSTTQSVISGFAGDFRERPAIGGYFLSLFSRSPSLRADSGHFGPQSPVQKFPFLGDLIAS
jgi:hypothetical protein